MSLFRGTCTDLRVSQVWKLQQIKITNRVYALKTPHVSWFFCSSMGETIADLWKTFQVKYPLKRFLTSWPWPLTYDLDLRLWTWPRYPSTWPTGQDSSMSVPLAMRVVTDRQTDRQCQNYYTAGADKKGPIFGPKHQYFMEKILIVGLKSANFGPKRGS